MPRWRRAAASRHPNSLASSRHRRRATRASGSSSRRSRGCSRRDGVGAADERRYWLPAEHVNVLVSEDHPSPPRAARADGRRHRRRARTAWSTAYRSGGGVPYPHFGAAFRKGQAGINRPAFLTDLVERWIPAAPDIHARLTSTSLRVADVGMRRRLVDDRDGARVSAGGGRWGSTRTRRRSPTRGRTPPGTGGRQVRGPRRGDAGRARAIRPRSSCWRRSTTWRAPAMCCGRFATRWHAGRQRPRRRRKGRATTFTRPPTTSSG